MTIINTGYSTLQDAWGEDFNKKKKTKKTKNDPLCDLYSKQYAKSLPPYTNSKRHDTSPNYPKEFKLNQHDYDKYYGYSDAKQFQRTRKDLRNSNANNNKKKFNIDGYLDKKYIYSTINHDEQEHNDYYHQQKYNVISTKNMKNSNKSNKSNSKSHKNQHAKNIHKCHVSKLPNTEEKFERMDYPKQDTHDKNEYIEIDENLKDYLDEEQEETPQSRQHINNMLDEELNYSLDEEDLDEEDLDEEDLDEEDLDEEDLDEEDLDEEDIHEEQYPHKIKKYTLVKNKNQNERQFLDTAIYSLSGVILIFMMEQFVQIGINMKKI